VIISKLFPVSFSTLQKLSPAFIFLFHFPSNIISVGLDFKFTFNDVLYNFTSKSLADVLFGNLINAVTSSKV
jgi:hypothetical protein